MKVAMIGLGMVSHTFGDAFQNSESVTLSSVFARSASSRTAFLDRWSNLGASEATSVDEIAGSDVDFVIVTTPPDARFDIVEKLAKAGKPILMEKPIERNLSNAQAIVEICENAGVPLGIVFQHRARPVIAQLQAALPSLGPMMAAEVNAPWWRPQSYYDEPGRGTYSRDGGGVLLTQAIHTLDLMLSLTGDVTEVNAMTATTGLHQMEAEDFACAGLRFANGAVGQLFASTASFPGRGETIILHFRYGSAQLGVGTLQIDWQDGRSEKYGQEAASGAGADPMAFSSDRHRAMVEDFADGLKDNRPPMVTGREGLRVHHLVDALEKSALAGAKIALKDI